jgi:hypothetical protein
VCRSHGAPIRLGREVTACHRNFTSHGPAAADPDCILDQATLSTLVLAVDQAYRDDHGDRGSAERRDLAEVVLAALGVTPTPGA